MSPALGLKIVLLSRLTTVIKEKESFFFFVINLAKVGYETLRLHVADFENTPSTKKTVEVSSVLKVKCQAELKRGFLSLIILT